MYCRQIFFSPTQLIDICKGLFLPFMEYAYHVYACRWDKAPRPKPFWAEDSKLFASLALFFSLTLLSPEFRRGVAYLPILYCYFRTNYFSELSNCIPSSFPRPPHARLSPLVYHYAALILIQELFLLLLVNSAIVFFLLFFHFPWNRILFQYFCERFDFL